MARPVREMFPSSGPSNPRKRIRPFSGAVGQDGDSRAPILVKGSASSAIRRQGFRAPIYCRAIFFAPPADIEDRRETTPIDSGRGRHGGCLERCLMTRQRPHDPRRLCGQGHDNDVGMGSGQKPAQPAPSCVWLLLSVGDAARAPWIGISRGYLSPRLVMPRSPGLPFGFARFHRREYGAPRPSGLAGGGAKGFAPRRDTRRRPTAIRRREQDRARPWLARG